MPFDPGQPYNDLPPLPPPHDIETKPVLRACISARASLAELNASSALIPNREVLIGNIPMLEAQASSEVENIVTTADRMFRDAGNIERSDPATKEALRYRRALLEGAEMIGHRPLSTNTAIQICRLIRNIDVDVRALPGTTLRNDATGAVIYTPPEGENRLRGLLANWEKYIHEAEQIDPLIRMAIMHYQFEAIHPFTDGNGRTGRILNLLYLIEQNLLESPILYLSRFIIEHRADYYRLLSNVTALAAWEDWILFILSAVTETAKFTTAKIKAIQGLMQRTAETVRQHEPKIYSRELVELIFLRPYCRIKDLVDAGIAKRQTASEYLNRLRDIGVLREMETPREKLFVNPDFLSLLEATKH